MSEDHAVFTESEPLGPGEIEIANENPNLVMVVDTNRGLDHILEQGVRCDGFVIDSDGALLHVFMPRVWGERMEEYGPATRLAVVNLDTGWWCGAFGAGEGWCGESLLEFLRGEVWSA